MQKSNNSVTFFGRVNDDLKYKLLSQAHLVLVPGVHEGWGLVVMESNAMGTPAIAYNVPGLRDSVRDGKTGILLKENSPDNLADTAISLLGDQPRLRELSRNALAFAMQFSRDNVADVFDNRIKEISKQDILPLYGLRTSRGNK
jgi:glycosyltransferase involved in cell wall biosynthesis